MIRANNYEKLSRFVKIWPNTVSPFFPDTVYIVPYPELNFSLDPYVWQSITAVLKVLGFNGAAKTAKGGLLRRL